MTQRSVLFSLVALCSALSTAAAAQDSPAWARPFPNLPPPPAVPSVPMLMSMPANREVFLPLLAFEARTRGLPPELADAVARIESGYNPGAIGRDGERGLMQVMPPTAAMLGFRGTPAELAEPVTNVRLGVAYLAEAWRLAEGDLCRALTKYRAGHGQERMSALSVTYCRRATAHLAAIGSPLAAGQAVTAENDPVRRVRTVVEVVRREPEGAEIAVVSRRPEQPDRVRRAAPVRNAETSSRFWAAHRARVRAIESRLPWKRRTAALRIGSDPHGARGRTAG